MQLEGVVNSCKTHRISTITDITTSFRVDKDPSRTYFIPNPNIY